MRYFFLVLFLAAFQASGAPQASGVEGDEAFIHPISGTQISTRAPKMDHPWRIETSLGLPNRGFTIQTENIESENPDPRKAVSYSPSVSLEGDIAIAYGPWGLSYSRTLAESSLDSSRGLPPSLREGFKGSLLLFNYLFEVGSERIQGMSTSLGVSGARQFSTLARPDIRMESFYLRFVRGIPIYGSKVANSLANFYSQSSFEPTEAHSVDILMSLDWEQNRIYGDTAFIPPERSVVFGGASTLREIQFTGLGGGLGLGYTYSHDEWAWYSLGVLVGGSANWVRAQYENQDQSGFGFGVHSKMWGAMNWSLGSQSNQMLGFKLAVNGWSVPIKDGRLNSQEMLLSLNYNYQF
jgi:hypothetical protein